MPMSARRIGKVFEFEIVARGVTNEHRSLLAFQALEADMRIQNKINIRSNDTLPQILPLVLRQHQSKMEGRDLITVDDAAFNFTRHLTDEMQCQLVAEEIDIDPVHRFALFGQAQPLAIKQPSFSEVRDGQCEVKCIH